MGLYKRAFDLFKSKKQKEKEAYEREAARREELSRHAVRDAREAWFKQLDEQTERPTGAYWPDSNAISDRNELLYDIRE